MNERYKPESPEFAALLEDAERFLTDALPRPGYAYEEITIPLSWLFNKQGKSRVVGYRRRDAFPRLVGGPSSLDGRIRNLQEAGLIRYQGTSRLPLEGWWGRLDLTEYQAAELRGRKVIPAGGEKLYELKVQMYDGEGRSTFPVDSYTFSDIEGMLRHEGRAKDPVASATQYLQRVITE
jgi:hypothetical protein